MGDEIIGYEDAKYYSTDISVQDGTPMYVVHGTCIYCNNILSSEDPLDNIVFCENCGWWHRVYERTGWGMKTCQAADGVLRRYSLDSVDVPIQALIKYLSNHPKDVTDVNPFVFEKLIADCLKDYFGNCDIIHIGGKRDRGIDLKLVVNDQKSFLVQIKRRKNLEKNESVTVVRELNGVMFRDNVPNGIIVTTAKGYTKDAINETRVLTETMIPYDMKLLAFNDVVKMLEISRTNPYRPWNNHNK